MKPCKCKPHRSSTKQTIPSVADCDGLLRPVVDEGDRHAILEVVLDLQTVALTIDEKASHQLEAAQAGVVCCRAVCPVALAVPLLGTPLDSFGRRT